MGKIISIANQKGGVGKTTTVVNLGASLAVAEKDVLLIDFDPQGNASSGFGIPVDEIVERNIYGAMTGSYSIETAIHKTSLESLEIVPCNHHLAGGELELVPMLAREYKLKDLISPLREKYDYILIDCPPSLGLLTVNALTAADSFIVPLQCEYYSLEGLSQLLNTVALIQKGTNARLTCEGILLTMFDARNKLSHQVKSEVEKHFGANVFKSMIPRNVRLSEAPSFGKPIILYDIHSKGCDSYLSFARELIQKGENQELASLQSSDFSNNIADNQIGV